MKPLTIFYIIVLLFNVIGMFYIYVTKTIVGFSYFGVLVICIVINLVGIKLDGGCYFVRKKTIRKI